MICPGSTLANKLAKQGCELHVVKPCVPAERWPLYPALRLLHIGFNIQSGRRLRLKRKQRLFRASPSGRVVKNLSATWEPQEIQLQSLGRGDPLEEGIASHSSILALRIPWPEEPGGLQSMGSQKSRHN